MITAIYGVTVAASFHLIYPVQSQFLPVFPAKAMILFLPHGVRVLTAWLYGWRSFGCLLPGALLSHWYLHGNDAMQFPAILSAFVGAACAAMAFSLLRLIGMDLRSGSPRRLEWRSVLLAGALASLMNSVGAHFAMGYDGYGPLVFIVGDIHGLVVLMTGLMLIFRWLRLRRR